MGPATLLLHSSETLFDWCVVFCLVLSGYMSGLFVCYFWSLGSRCFLVWCPLRPAPYLDCCSLSSLSFFGGGIVGMFVDDVFFFFLIFSFSLSLRCWGTTNPCGVCVSPSVSSSWTRTPTSTRTSSSYPSPRLSRGFSCLVSPSCLVGSCVCVWWVVFLHSSLASCNACCKRGGAARDMPPPFYHHCHLLGCFGGMGVRGCPGVPRLNPLHPPLRLPGRIPEIQGLGGRRGRGAFGRQLYCHTCVARSPLVGGNAVRFFFFLCFLCLVRRLLPFFAVLLFLGSLSEKIFGSELLFLVVGVVLVFFGGFLPMFLLYAFAARSRTCLENSLDVRSCFLRVCSLFFGFFFVDAVFFKRHSSGSKRTPRHALVLLFLVRFCFVPPRLFVPPTLAVRPASWRFSRGAILGPACFWDSP